MGRCAGETRERTKRAFSLAKCLKNELEYQGFDPRTSSLLRTRASDCANTPAAMASWSQGMQTPFRDLQNALCLAGVPDSLGG